MQKRQHSSYNPLTATSIRTPSTKMKIIFNQPLNLLYSTEIVIEKLKRKKRRTTDTYDYNDPLIEHVENEDDLVYLEADLKNFFVYTGKLKETAIQTLKTYEQKNKKRTVKTKNTKKNTALLNGAIGTEIAETIAEKNINFYIEEKKRITDAIIGYYREHGSAFENEKQTTANDACSVVPDIERDIEEYVILESIYTKKTFNDISHDIVTFNGPALSNELLKKIDNKMKNTIETLTITLKAKIKEIVSTNNYDKNVVFSVCDLIDKKVRKYYLSLLITSEPRKNYRKVRREIFNDVFSIFGNGNFNRLKKLIHRFDYFKEKKRLQTETV